MIPGLHIFTSFLNVFFYDLTPKGAMEPITDIEQRIENEQTLGAAKIEEMRHPRVRQTCDKLLHRRRIDGTTA